MLVGEGQKWNIKCFANDSRVFVAGRAWAVRVDSGSIYRLFDYSEPANKRQKESIFGFTVFHERLLFRVTLAPEKLYD